MNWILDWFLDWALGLALGWTLGWKPEGQLGLVHRECLTLGVDLDAGRASKLKVIGAAGLYARLIIRTWLP